MVEMVVMPKGRFFLLPATFFFKSASNEETSKLQHYEFTVVLLYNICCVGTALLSVLDKYKIIKSKRLRYFIFIVVYTLACWGIYDLVLAPK